MNIKERFPFLKSSEDVISMILGLLIVVVVAGLIINYFQKKNTGSISLVGVSDSITLTPEAKTTEVATPTLQPIKKIEGSEYVVVRGDNLWKIAMAKYGSGYNWVDIAAANKMANAGMVVVGQKLVLPEVAPRMVTVAKIANPIEGDEYVVVKGDSLSKIALRAYSDSFSWPKIYEANKKIVRNPDIIWPGTKLVIPR